jgi:GntP family gluconate:H+ symporter
MSAPLILLVSMAAVILLMIAGRVHAFLSLLAGALLVGILSPVIPLDTVPASVAGALGRVAGSIAIVISLAAIIGECLLDSGAAERISRRFLKFFGERRAHFSLWGSGYVLSVPVFFDTVFYLLLPLARAMTARQGRNYALNISAVAVGGASTHVFVPPTPGPLAAATGLGVDLGLMIFMGLVVALPASLVALAYAAWREARSPSTIRAGIGATEEELAALVARPDSALPSFGLSMLPIALPVLLIAGRTAAEAAGAPPAILQWAKFFGDANMALLISAVVALWLVKTRAGLSLVDLRDRVDRALTGAGPIILITAAGGAYGGMLTQAQVGGSLQQIAQSMGLPLLGLAFGMAAILKIAQGSSTVAIITTTSVLATIYASGADGLPHPVYAALATGGGSLVVSWMNDSGFWLVGRMGGFTEPETFKVWTIPAAIVGVVGFLVAALLSVIVPMR